MKEVESFTTPILFLIFNRPDTTQRVWEVIRQVRPKYLYVAADGPRPSRADDLEKTSQTKAIIQPDWECDLVTLYRDENLGCRNAVSGAITWFFEHVEEGIILEDDCLPDPSFFQYCSVLLDKYRSNTRIMHIGGCNFQDGRKRGEGSYYFSKYNHIWGWATWRRAWQLYDVDMGDYSNNSLSKNLNNVFFDNTERKYWIRKFEDIRLKNFDTWDTQWTYCIFNNNGKAIVPNYNLVRNIGFGNTATHTQNINKRYDVPVSKINQIKILEIDDLDIVADLVIYFKQISFSRYKTLKLSIELSLKDNKFYFLETLKSIF